MIFMHRPRSTSCETNQHSTDVKEHYFNAKVTYSTYRKNPILRRGSQNEHGRLYQNSSVMYISHRVHQKSRKMPSKKHKITRLSFKKVRIEKSLRHWLAVIANRNQTFSIRHKWVHTTRTLGTFDYPKLAG